MQLDFKNFNFSSVIFFLNFEDLEEKSLEKKSLSPTKHEEEKIEAHLSSKLVDKPVLVEKSNEIKSYQDFDLIQNRDTSEVGAKEKTFVNVNDYFNGLSKITKTNTMHPNLDSNNSIEVQLEGKLYQNLFSFFFYFTFYMQI